jgi:hypothetical protein
MGVHASAALRRSEVLSIVDFAERLFVIETKKPLGDSRE